MHGTDKIERRIHIKSKRFERKSIIRQIMVQMLFILIIPVLFVCFFYYFSYRNTLYRDAQKKLQDYVIREKTVVEDNIGHAVSALDTLVYNQEFLYFLNDESQPDERELSLFYQGLQEEWIGIRHTYPNLFEELRIYSSNLSVRNVNNWKMEIVGQEEFAYSIPNTASDLWYGVVADAEYGGQNQMFSVEESNLPVFPVCRCIRDFRTGDVVGVIELDVSFANMIQTEGLRGETDIRMEYTDEAGNVLYRTAAPAVNERILSYSEGIEDTDLALCASIPVHSVTAAARRMIWRVGVVAFAGILFMMILTYRAVRSSLRRLIVMDEAMAQVETGHFDITMPDDGYEDEISRTKKRFGLMAERLDEVVQRMLEERKAKNDAELRALQAQINPHFLFNILETMHMQCEIDRYYKVGNGLAALGNLMRYSMKWEGHEVPFSVEWTQLTNYLSLMQLRMDDDLTLDLGCDDSLKDIIVPKMFLQPVVENSFQHGFKGVPAPWYLSVRANRENDRMIIRIRDNGCGVDPARLSELQTLLDERTGIHSEARDRRSIGLVNVLQRMDMICKEGSTILLRNGENGGIEIDIVIQI